MKRLVSVILATLVVAFAGAELRADDSKIAQEIVARLRHQQKTSQLKGFNIGIQVDQATVTMMGQVASREQATLALEVARRVPGVKLVINDLQVRPPVAGIEQPAAASGAPGSHQQALHEPPLPSQMPQLTQNPEYGSRPQPSAGFASHSPRSAQLTGGYSGYSYPQQARPIAPATPPHSAAMPQPQVPSAQQYPAAQWSQATPPQAAQRPQAAHRPPVPYAPAYSLAAQRASASRMPVTRTANTANTGTNAQAAPPVPMQAGAAGPGVVAPAYDQPVMPQHAWPSYASYPNYAAVSYPTQYSATAWPYIGPFYPYPQVPLGWRKVSLEWDDGWWFLDFHAKSEQ